MNRKIAIYGKGGIGKTTLSVNLALRLAASGKRVLLIGCDPKSDTARLLLQKPIPTVMDNYNAIHSGAVRIDEVCIEARHNLWCCEAGGPRPGVGCAGRGVLIALDLLKNQGKLDEADIVLYDVLGDVVCGGFATPVTHGFTDQILIVTSGEQASLLAANNIIAGMAATGGSIGGLIFNARGFDGEDSYVRMFSSRVNVPIVGCIPYSQKIKLAELRRRAIGEVESAVEENQAIERLSGDVLALRSSAIPAALPQEELYDMIAKNREAFAE